MQFCVELERGSCCYVNNHMAGRRFSLRTPVSSTNKADRHNITEKLLKVALNTITLTLNNHCLSSCFRSSCSKGIQCPTQVCRCHLKPLRQIKLNLEVVVHRRSPLKNVSVTSILHPRLLLLLNIEIYGKIFYMLKYQSRICMLIFICCIHFRMSKSNTYVNFYMLYIV